MRAGLLKYWISFEEKSFTRSDSGARVISWNEVYRCKAAKPHQSSKAVIENFEQTHEETITFIVRYLGHKLNRDWRISYNGEKYSISGLDFNEFTDRTYTIIATRINE